MSIVEIFQHILKVPWNDFFFFTISSNMLCISMYAVWFPICCLWNVKRWQKSCFNFFKLGHLFFVVALNTHIICLLVALNTHSRGLLVALIAKHWLICCSIMCDWTTNKPILFLFRARSKHMIWVFRVTRKPMP